MTKKKVNKKTDSKESLQQYRDCALTIYVPIEPLGFDDLVAKSIGEIIDVAVAWGWRFEGP